MCCDVCVVMCGVCVCVCVCVVVVCTIAQQSLVALVLNMKETFSRHVSRLEIVRVEKAKRQQAIEGIDTHMVHVHTYTCGHVYVCTYIYTCITHIHVHTHNTYTCAHT